MVFECYRIRSTVVVLLCYINSYSDSEVNTLKYLTRDELRALTNDELLTYVNTYLANGNSMNNFEKHHHTTKKYIKSR